MLGAMAQRSYTFNAVALNVDGLPKEILSIEINPDGKEADGATELCGILANSGWDIVGFSEDFNFHDYLTAAPASTYYNFGEHGGEVSSTSNSTDGLGFACAKRFTFSGGSRTKWTSLYGGSGLFNVGDNGADGMINKGFRFYTVTLATGVAVDVYVLHMDANTADSDDDYDSNGRDKNVVAREAQLKQLADDVVSKMKTNKRPVIILGDTNCRYTREQLKTLFIDVINADSRFTIEDAWVELMWGGAYPTYGGEAMMTHTYGMQKGEIVDKVFYINTTESNLTLKANSYLHDESVTVSDHKPVVVNFTLTDPNGTPLTDAEKENNWTLDESAAGNQKPKWEGEQVKSGTAYYLMNVGTGEYIKWGGSYYTEAVGGYGGTPITPITSDGGASWVLKTSRNHVGDGDYTYLDQTGTWYLEPVNGTSYQYRIRSTRNLYLTANTSEAHHPIKSEAYSDASDNQKWVFLTDDRIRTEMTKATSEYPFNFTALLKSADFDAIEIEDGWANNWDGFDWSGGGTNNLSGNGPFKGSITGWNNDFNHAAYSTYAYANTTSAVSMSQDLGTLPNGTYEISFEGFYRANYKTSRWGGTKEETVSATVKFGSAGSVAIKQNKSTNIGDDAHSVFKNDTYATNGSISMGSSAGVTLSVNMPATTGYSRTSGWICVDNFRLKYYGTGEVYVDPYKDFKDQVRAKVNETYPKVMALNAAGQAAYDITTVVNRYNNDQIRSATDANALCDMVDKAYANAYAAHLAYNVSQVIANMGANGGDITGAILNPSFETGDVTGWTTAGGGWDVNVYPNSNATYQATGCDGDYLFNSYGGDNDHTAYVRQTIKGIPNGLYELKAKVTSFGIIGDNKTHDYHIYLTGNSYHTSVAADQGKTVFKEATLYFLVEDGTATIGAIGGNKGGGTEFIHYWPFQGCFFKADDFRLKYICDVPHGRLKLALDEANATKLDGFGQIALDLSSYQAAYDNKSLTTDGKAEVAAIYDALQVAAKAQKTAGADMTWAIENPNFETGDYTGWNVTVQWDTRVGTQESDIKVAGADGRYFFNTWNNANGTNNTNEHITQTVTGIPNGTYRLTAMLATDNGTSLELTGNGETTPIAASTNGNSSGVFPTVECEVTDNTLTIEAGGAGGAWYKADNFRLTLVEPAETPELVFNHTATTITAIEDITFPRVVLQRPIKAKDSKGNPAWSSFVAPFDIPAFGGWDYMKLSGATYKESSGNISLQFTKVETIEAGVPYMVRCTTMTETLQQIEMGETSVNTVTKKDTRVTITGGNGSTVTFKGVYTAGNVPQGAFFISDNTFYQAANGTNTLKGFRGYIQIEGSLASKARSMSFRWDDGTTSIDNGQLTNDNEVTTVAIYNERGMRLTEMQQGINILLMSDGTTVKVVIR